MSQHDYRSEASRQLSEARRDLGERSILAFGRAYLSHYLKLPSSRMHEEICELLQTAARKRGARLAFAAPRGHAKSTLVTLAYVLWCICYEKESYTLLISNTGDQANDQLSFIKEELETNPLLQTDFPTACEVPGVKPGPKRWRKNEIITRNGVKVSALGAGMKVRGRRNRQQRPTLIILDDVENETSVRSEDQRRHLNEWFTKTVSKAGTHETNIIVVGTILHYDSLLAGMVKNNNQHIWSGRRYQAVRSFSVHPELWQEWEAIVTLRREHQGASGDSAARAFFEDHQALMLSGTDVLWHECEDYYRLMLLRVNDGHRSFASEKQNEPIDPEECLFREESMLFWDDEYPDADWLIRVIGERGQIVGACDPSMGRRGKGRDPSAIVVVLKDTKSGLMYVLECDIAYRTPRDTINAIIEFHRRYRFKSFGMEVVQAQEFIADELKVAARLAGLSIPVNKIKQTTDKLGRIQSLEPAVSAGNIRFSRRHTTLLDQMWQFPHGAHDDGPDALEMVIRERVKKPRITFMDMVTGQWSDPAADIDDPKATPPQPAIPPTM